MRATYRNGDPIDLTHCGCDSCKPVRINGMLCHETGCPDAWRDREAECFQCGYEFYPTEKGQRLCPDCLDPEPPDDPYGTDWFDGPDGDYLD